MWFLIFCIFYKGTIVFTEQVNPILELEDGKLEGVLLTTDTGTNYYAFREIPYAKPPIGDLRFTEPVPSEKWSGIRDATKNTKICMQKVLFDIPASDPRENEDCLYINVFTPQVNAKYTELLPIYVYFQGGMNVAGDLTEYNFQGFIDRNIIAVSMGFRQSSLGFLSTDDGVIPANLYLKDQILGLKWVQKNIKKFGGDPEKVTIGGHSSGANAVGVLILSPKSSGLFRAAIMQSGTPLMRGRMLNATEAAYSFAETFEPKARSMNTQQLLNYLRTLPAEKIARSDFKKRPDFVKAIFFGAIKEPWGYAVENATFKNAAIVGPLHENFENGNFNHVPILIGITNEELADYMYVYFAKDIDSRLDLLDVGINIKPKNRRKANLELKDMYTTTEKLADNATAILQMAADVEFTIPIIQTAYLASKFSDVYLYQFSYKGPLNGLETWRNNPVANLTGIGNADHCSELPLLYYYRLNPKVTPTDEDLLMRRKMINLWANFIKYTNPTPVKDPLFDEIIWPKTAKTDLKYVDISLQMEIRCRPRRFFEWKEKIFKYFEYPKYIY
ncbi:unnamed protein product [Phyllotreta striolata]|uniref:Carboxylic ester hydrolase n=1 Tax=Phyllotreta striolata TaxID=444603 RepID=A0A9N9TGY1_PHYSR|nr:unnamed protein product [Phyllotreta striolata]